MAGRDSSRQRYLSVDACWHQWLLLGGWLGVTSQAGRAALHVSLPGTHSVGPTQCMCVLCFWCHHVLQDFFGSAFAGLAGGKKE
jgi:hypothetical protein